MFPRRHLALLFETPEGGSGGGAPLQAPVSTETPDTPANTPDTGTGGTDTQPESSMVPEARYTNLQGAFTRASQEAAEYRRVIEGLNSDDPEVRSWAAQQIGIEFLPDDDAPDDTQQAQYAQLDPRVQQQLEQLLTSEQEKQQQAQAESEMNAYREWAGGRLDSLGVPEGLRETVADAALNMPPVWTVDGEQPDIEGAWNNVLEFLERAADVPQVRTRVLDAYSKSKQAPHVAQSGQAGVQVPDLSDRNTRQARIEALYQGEGQQ